MITEMYPALAESWGLMIDEERLNVVRSIRNTLLAQSDWTQLPDSPLTDAKRAEWATYRQALRDILQTYSENLLEVEFPDPPSNSVE